MRRGAREAGAGKAGIAELLFIDLLLAGAALGLFLLERRVRPSEAPPAIADQAPHLEGGR